MANKRIEMYSIERLLNDLEYDLTLKLNVADEDCAYKMGVLTAMIKDARDTVRIFREMHGIEKRKATDDGIKTETIDDFDDHPLTIL